MYNAAGCAAGTDQRSHADVADLRDFTSIADGYAGGCVRPGVDDHGNALPKPSSIIAGLWSTTTATAYAPCGTHRWKSPLTPTSLSRPPCRCSRESARSPRQQVEPSAAKPPAVGNRVACRRCAAGSCPDGPPSSHPGPRGSAVNIASRVPIGREALGCGAAGNRRDRSPLAARIRYSESSSAQLYGLCRKLLDLYTGFPSADGERLPARIWRRSRAALAAFQARRFGRPPERRTGRPARCR